MNQINVATFKKKVVEEPKKKKKSAAGSYVAAAAATNGNLYLVKIIKEEGSRMLVEEQTSRISPTPGLYQQLHQLQMET